MKEEIVFRDCDGKPIKVGDIVEYPADADDPAFGPILLLFCEWMERSRPMVVYGSVRCAVVCPARECKLLRTREENESPEFQRKLAGRMAEAEKMLADAGVPPRGSA